MRNSSAMDEEIDVLNDTNENSALPIEYLIPEDENTRKNKYGSIVVENDEEESQEILDATEGEPEAERTRTTSSSVVCNCNNTCSRKQSKRSAGCPCKNANKKCGTRCKCGTSKLQCKNGKQENIELQNAQRLPASAFDRHSEDIAKATEEIKVFVSELSVEKKDELLVKFLAQGKGSLDFAKNMLAAENTGDVDNSVSSEPGQQDWCDCGQCVSRENPDECKCCKLRSCITSYKLFENLCLDRNVLETAIKARSDIRAEELDFGMNSFRKASYRQYILWRYGRLGKGNRKVVPSCLCEWFEQRTLHQMGTIWAFAVREMIA